MCCLFPIIISERINLSRSTLSLSLSLSLSLPSSMASLLHTSFSLLLLSILFCPFASSSSTPFSSLQPHNATAAAFLQSICHSTPYPAACIDSLKLSISININPSILSLAIQSLRAAMSDAVKLSGLLTSVRGSDLVEAQRGSLQDCQDLHQITVSALKRSSALVNSGDARKLADVRAYLAASLTNKNTCIEGLGGARGPLVSSLVSSWLAAYAHVSNSLSLVTRSSGRQRRPNGRRRLLSSDEFPAWVGRRERRLLADENYDDYDDQSVLTVAADGTGNFTTVSDAVNFTPNSSDTRTIIVVRAGVYDEHVEIPSYKTNIVLIGDGRDVTVIRGNRSVGNGWTTFRSATVSVSGDGFLARDISFLNVAGPKNSQAVALRVNADLVAIYHCAIDGYQDTLYVHSFRQFYRECDISGTVDFIFGNAAVVFQGCNIIAKKPLPGQSNIVTAQSRDDPDEVTGISIQNCTVVASDDLAASSTAVKTYLGRPWRNYSRTVYMESYLDSLVDPAGWSQWSAADDDEKKASLYYGEYENGGPGAATDRRAPWPGVHVSMDYDEAYAFSVSEFIYGDEWLQSTSFPYDDGI